MNTFETRSIRLGCSSFVSILHDTVKGGSYQAHLVNYNDLWQAHYHEGWAKTPPSIMLPFTVTYPEDPLGPDSIGVGENAVISWPDTHVVPFHYNVSEYIILYKQCLDTVI